jgi:hypothetical protein
VRPGAVAARRRPAELLPGDDALARADENALAQVAVDRAQMAAEAETSITIPSTAAKTGTPIRFSRKERMIESSPV